MRYPYLSGSVHRIITHVRAAVYLRISDDKTGEELGVTRQREDCLKLCEQRGWVVAEVYVDNDISASGKVRRPRFDAMLQAVERGEVEIVVSWALDRLTRNRRDQVRIVETCEPRRVVLALVRGSDIDMSTPSGRFTADMLASVARHEIEQKGDRQRRAAQQAAERGQPAGGPVPFGFSADRIHHHPEQAAAIRDACGAVLAGASLAGIARQWNRVGLTSGKIRTGRGRAGQPSAWSAETVRRALLRPGNCGLRSYRGEIIGTGSWEPIVPEDVWRAVHALLTSPSRRGRPPSPRHLLSGVALCGVCGHSVVAGTRRPHYGHAYRCGDSNGHVARRGDWVDAYVSQIVIARLSQPDARDLLIDDGRPDLPALRNKASTLRAQIDALAAEFGISDPDDVIMAAREFRLASERLRARLAEVEAQLADVGRVNIFGPLVGAENVAAAWEELDTDRQRVVIDALMVVKLQPVGRGARTFKPETVEIVERTGAA